MTMTTKELLALVGSFPEANIRNYGDDEVVALNDWGCQMVDAATALCAEVEAMRKDAERLDWLETQGIAYGFEDMHEGNSWAVSGAYANVRAAIDAAKEPK